MGQYTIVGQTIFWQWLSLLELGGVHLYPNWIERFILIGDRSDSLLQIVNPFLSYQGYVAFFNIFQVQTQ